ncbi:MAG: hypothetical protein AAF236_08455 [Verrucomicrobiota bacterium]
MQPLSLLTAAPALLAACLFFPAPTLRAQADPVVFSDAAAASAESSFTSGSAPAITSSQSPAANAPTASDPVVAGVLPTTTIHSVTTSDEPIYTPSAGLNGTQGNVRRRAELMQSEMDRALARARQDRAMKNAMGQVVVSAAPAAPRTAAEFLAANPPRVPEPAEYETPEQFNVDRNRPIGNITPEGGGSGSPVAVDDTPVFQPAPTPDLPAQSDRSFFGWLKQRDDSAGRSERGAVVNPYNSEGLASADLPSGNPAPASGGSIASTSGSGSSEGGMLSRLFGRRPEPATAVQAPPPIPPSGYPSEPSPSSSSSDLIAAARTTPTESPSYDRIPDVPPVSAPERAPAAASTGSATGESSRGGIFRERPPEVPSLEVPFEE